MRPALLSRQFRPRVCVRGHVCVRVCARACMRARVCFAIPCHCGSANWLITAARLCVCMCMCMCVTVSIRVYMRVSPLYFVSIVQVGNKQFANSNKNGFRMDGRTDRRIDRRTDRRTDASKKKCSSWERGFRLSNECVDFMQFQPTAALPVAPAAVGAVLVAAVR